MTTQTYHKGMAPAQSGALSRVWTRIKANVAAHIRRQSRCATVQALQSKSDAELAAMGLQRDQIIPHVFSNRGYW